MSRRMIWSLVLVVILMLAGLESVFPVKAQTPAAPYIYYYSDKMKAFIVERADGTDTHIFGEGLMHPADGTLPEISGPGWSPSGKWFAWNYSHIGAYGAADPSKPYVVKTDGSQRIPLPDDLQDARMAWAPHTDRLFIADTYFEPVTDNNAKTTGSGGYQHVDLYMIDVAANKILVSNKWTWFHKPEAQNFVLPVISWLDDAHAVVTYQSPPYIQDHHDWQSYTSIMDVEGNMSRIQVDSSFFSSILPDGFNAMSGDPQTSPDGRYTASVNDALIIQDTHTATRQVLRPAVRSYDSESDGKILWNSDSTWLFDFHDGLVASGGACCYHIGIAKVDGSVRRDLTHVSWPNLPVTVGWLPPQVNVSDLSPTITKPTFISPQKTLKGTGWYFGLQWSPDGKQLLGYGGGWSNTDLTVWDVTTGDHKVAVKYDTSQPAYQDAIWVTAPDGNYVAQLIPALSNDWNGKFVFAIGGEQRLAFALDSKASEIWGVFDFKTGKLIHEIADGGKNFTSASFSSDGRWLAISGPFEESTQIWDTRIWEVVTTLPNPAPAVAFSPDSKHLAVSQSWDVELYNVSDLIPQNSGSLPPSF